jgi:hypothetical protein
MRYPNRRVTADKPERIGNFLPTQMRVLFFGQPSARGCLAVTCWVGILQGKSGDLQEKSARN